MLPKGGAAAIGGGIVGAALPPSCDKSKSIGETPTGGGAGGGTDEDVPNPPKAPKSSSIAVAGGFTSVDVGEAKPPKGSSPPKAAGAGEVKPPKAASSPPMLLSVGAAGIAGAALKVSKAAGSAAGVGKRAAEGDSRGVLGVVMGPSWLRGGMPRAWRRLCSMRESDHDQASSGVSNDCQIDVFHAGPPGLRSCCDSTWSSVGQPVTPVPCKWSEGGNALRRASNNAIFSAAVSVPSKADAGTTADAVGCGTGGGVGAGAEPNESKPSPPQAPVSKSPKS